MNDEPSVWWVIWLLLRMQALEISVLGIGIPMLLVLYRSFDGGARVLIATITSVFLAYAYLALSLFVMNLAFRWDRPMRWENLFNSRSVAALSWLQIPHTLALAVSALPIALCVLEVSRRWAFALGLLIGVLSMFPSWIPALVARAQGNASLVVSGPHAFVHAVNTAKILLEVRLLAWLIIWLRTDRAASARA